MHLYLHLTHLQKLVYSKNKDIYLTMFPHKIQKLRAYILQKLLVMVVAVANKNVLLHAYMDPQIFQMV